MEPVDRNDLISRAQVLAALEDALKTEMSDVGEGRLSSWESGWQNGFKYAQILVAALPLPEPPADLLRMKMRLLLAAGHVSTYDLRADMSNLLDEYPVSPLPLTRERIDAVIEQLENVCRDCESEDDGIFESCDKHKAMWELSDALLKEGE